MCRSGLRQRDRINGDRRPAVHIFHQHHFWTIYNQNSTGLTIWAEKHTDQVASETTAKITGAIFPMQEVTDAQVGE